MDDRSVFRNSFLTASPSLFRPFSLHMTPHGNKRRREVKEQPKMMVPIQTGDCTDTEDNSEFDYSTDDDDLDTIIDISDCEDLDEEEEIYGLMHHADVSDSDLIDCTYSTDAMDVSELCVEEKTGTAIAQSVNGTGKKDFHQSMETISCADTVSSDMSTDPDWISTDDEEALEEYLVYKEILRQKKIQENAKRTELEPCDDIDAINMRYWTKGSTAAKGKPCTMTSSAGPAARIEMRRFVLPAQEMLKNYFRSVIPKRFVGKSKENGCVSRNKMDIGVKINPNRIALSEKN